MLTKLIEQIELILVFMKRLIPSDRFEDKIHVARSATQELSMGASYNNLTLTITDIIKELAGSKEVLMVEFVARGIMRGTNASYTSRQDFAMAEDGHTHGDKYVTIDTISGNNGVLNVTPTLVTEYNMQEPPGSHNPNVLIHCPVNADGAVFIEDNVIEWVFEINGHALKFAGPYC